MKPGSYLTIRPLLLAVALFSVIIDWNGLSASPHVSKYFGLDLLLVPGVQELLLDPPGFDGRFLTEPKPLPPTPVPFMLNVPSCSKKISGIQILFSTIYR